MTHFPLHTLDTAPEGARATLDAVAQAWGFVPRMHAALAESPAALNGYEALWSQIGASTLTPVEQQVAYQAVNVLHGCGYCVMGHTYLSRQAGMDEDSISRLRAGRAPADPKLAALWSFTRAVAENRGEAAGAVREFLAAGFSTANALDVITIIAAKVIANYTAAVTGLPPEDFMSDPALAWTPANAAAAE